MRIDEGCDRLMAYGCKGVIVSILENLLNATPEDMTEKEYIEMCGKILKLLAECLVEE